MQTVTVTIEVKQVKSITVELETDGSGNIPTDTSVFTDSDWETIDEAVKNADICHDETEYEIV